jgi:tetratricopeptide (TPR) repeat protein
VNFPSRRHSVFWISPRSAPISVVPLALLIVTLAFLPSSSAQQKTVSPAKSAAKSSSAPSSANQKPASSLVDVELQKRMKAAEAARQSEDPAAIAQANGLLIAFCLREMGQLRLLEGAYPESIALYRRSLDFEDLPDVRVDLAIAYLDANKLDDSLAQAKQAIASDPKNARAWNVQGKVWIRKEDPNKAAESLQRSIELHPDVEAAYSLGIALLSAKQKEKADAVFQQMVASLGDSGALRVLFARAYRDENFMEETISNLKMAIALDPKTQHAHYFLGLSYLIVHEWAPSPEARKEFLTEVQFNPRDYLSNYFLGVMASIERQYVESDRYLKVATEISPDSPEAWLYLGLNAYTKKDNKQAELLLRKSIALAGEQVSEAHYLIRRGYFVLGRILLNSGRKEEAEIYLQKARKLQILASEAKSRSTMGEDTVAPVPEKEEEVSLPLGAARGSMAQLDASVMASANLTEKQRKDAASEEKNLRAILGSGFNDLATSEAVRGQYDLALGHYHDAEHWDTAIPDLMRNIGFAAFRKTDYAETVRVLSKVVGANPPDNQARTILGMAYFATDDYANAAHTIAPLGDLAMHDPGLRYTWAASLSKLGETKDAARVLDGIERGQLSTETLMLVGQLWIDIGDYSRAVEVLHRALQMDASLPKAHFYSGLAQLRADHFTEAAAEFKAELDLVPGDPDTEYDLGFAYLQQSQRELASDLFRTVISSHPEYANAQYQLGKILLDRGDVKEAILHLEQAARLSPQADYVHYQLQAAYRKDSRKEEADRELQLYRETKARNQKRETTSPSQEQ